MHRVSYMIVSCWVCVSHQCSWAPSWTVCTFISRRPPQGHIFKSHYWSDGCVDRYAGLVYLWYLYLLPYHILSILAL